MPIESLQTAQFRHGPLELAGPDLAAMVIATEPETRDLDVAMAGELSRSAPRCVDGDTRRYPRVADRHRHDRSLLRRLLDRPRAAPRVEARASPGARPARTSAPRR